MGTFTLTADFSEIDGDQSTTKRVYVRANTQVKNDATGRIFDDGHVAVNNGILSVELPAIDNAPGTFGFVVTRVTGRTQKWNVPAQAAGTTVKLTQFTSTTPLPLPPSAEAALRAELEALMGLIGAPDPRFPSYPYPPPPDFDWAGVIYYYELDPVTGAVVDAYEAPGV